MATITHPTGNGYCRDRILRDRPATTVPPSALGEEEEAFRKKTVVAGQTSRLA